MIDIGQCGEECCTIAAPNRNGRKKREKKSKYKSMKGDLPHTYTEQIY